MKKIFLLMLVCKAAACFAQEVIESPDKAIKVLVNNTPAGQVYYTIYYRQQLIIDTSFLGVIRDDEDFSTKLIFLNASLPEKIKDDYEMMYAKKRNITYRANKKILHYRSAAGQLLDIIFQVSDDGVAFRYVFPSSSTAIKKINQENTFFSFLKNTTAWLQPMSVAKSGWEHTNPAYEEHYLQNIPAGAASPTKAGWVFPALFQYKNIWMLLSETGVDSSYCGSRLQTYSADGKYTIGFPDSAEVMNDGGLNPQSALPWHTPWRIITIGSLKTIAESTLGTDLAGRAVKLNKEFIKPGKASWSWIMSKDDFIIYDEQKKYIDFAADMRWQYCLIDADWDIKIGYEKIKELAAYAAAKKVGLLLWYNSSGNWNTTKYHPKSKLLTHEDRVKEFTRLQAMGIKGIKVDFFGGDGRSVIKYYTDILNDAAQFKLLVNFHGATLPRGWQRTYPHLLTTEAVRGFEMVTFSQEDADRQATHCTVLPFTRNAFDPMDFTPMNLYKIPTKVTRKTTAAFELALSVIFLSGIQHFAESPDGMNQMPLYVKKFLQNLPVQWDNVKFIQGYPGKEIIIARRAGNVWYIAGINGEATNKTFGIDLSFFKKNNMQLITDSDTGLAEKILKNNRQITVSLKPNGGFVIVLK